MPVIKKPALLLLILACWTIGFPYSTSAQISTGSEKRPRIALVLSGGGAKGFAHIGVLKVLEKEGIPIDLIVGTSIGSLVGGVYAIGYDASYLEKLAKSLDWETTLSDEIPRAFLSKNDQLIKQRYLLSLPINGNKKLSLPQGILKGQNILNLFCDLAGNVPPETDFLKFPIPFACVTTDLESGKEVVLRNGFLPMAMFSSMAIPIAIQSPVYKGLLLADGGLVNNFPTDVAKKMGADLIIGVDIRDDHYDRKNLKSLNNVAGQLIRFFDQSKDSINHSLCEVIIHPDVTNYSMSSFNRQAVDTLIFRGEKAANSCISQLRELKEKYHLLPEKKPANLVKSDTWHIADLSFSDNYFLDTDFLRKTFNLEIPGDYSSEEIKAGIDRLYGLGGFDRIYYSLTDTPQGKILNVNISTKEVFSQNIGFKANTTDAAAIMLNLTQKNYKNLIGLFSISAELSVNPELNIVAETNKTKFPTLGLSLKSKYQNYSVYEDGEKAYQADLFHTSASLYFYQPFMSKFNLGIGLQEEYDHGEIFRKIASPGTTDEISSFLTEAYGYLTYDNMDDFYFPSKGTNVYAEFSHLFDFNKLNQINPVGLFRIKNVFPVQKYTAFLLDFYGRAIFSSENPFTRITMVGGEPYSQYFNYHLPFVGLPAVTIAGPYTYLALAGIRFQVAKSHYVSFLANGMWQGTDPLLNFGLKATYGGGIKYSVKTFLGPLDITWGYCHANKTPTFSANFGYWF